MKCPFKDSKNNCVHTYNVRKNMKKLPKCIIKDPLYCDLYKNSLTELRGDKDER